MATDRRVARVAESIRREVSQMLLSEIKDDRVGMGMVSVTDVQVAGDLQHAKIFVSIYGTDEDKAESMAGLRSATSFVRGELGRRIRLRRTPEVVFLEDTSLERGDRILSLINRISQERKPELDEEAAVESGVALEETDLDLEEEDSDLEDLDLEETDLDLEDMDLTDDDLPKPLA